MFSLASNLEFKLRQNVFGSYVYHNESFALNCPFLSIKAFFKNRAFVLIFSTGIFLIAMLLITPSQAGIGLDFARLREHFLNSSSNTNEAAFNDWHSLIDRNKGLATATTLKQVNDFVNKQIRFESDVQIWNKNDYWATPMQSLGMQRGDCEDYSIAKYFTLAAAGVPEEKLRLMYVQAVPKNQYPQAHMVLAYYATPDAEPLVLDNLNSEILPASARVDLKPVYSLARRDTSSSNMDNNDTQSRLKEAMRQTRMSVWESLIKRAQAEGFD